MKKSRRQYPKKFPAQHQKRQPGVEYKMRPQPEYTSADYRGSGKLTGKVAVVTGGDSGIGRAAAVAFAKEQADVAIIYLRETADAIVTMREIEAHGGRCILIKGDVGDPAFCRRAIKQVMKTLGRIDILVNNAAEQHPQDDFLKITPRQLIKTFQTNIFSYFYMTRAALAHLQEGAAIINTASVTAYRGSEHLIDYSSTKGAIVTFTRSLALNLADQKIRVNGVAPGPIWTPLIPASFKASHVKKFGKDTPMKRAGQPAEVAPCFVFLACADSSYMTGQMLHPNGGEIVNA